MSIITNDLKKENPTDREIQVSYHTKPPCLRAVHPGRQRVFNVCSRHFLPSGMAYVQAFNVYKTFEQATGTMILLVYVGSMVI